MPDRFTLYSAGAGVYGIEDTTTGEVAIFGPYAMAQQGVSLLTMGAIPADALFWVTKEVAGS